MEEIRLRYWQWFSYADDAGVVQISAFDSVGGWSVWQSVGESITGASGVWSRRDVDLTEYAGQTIRIGFFHNAEVNTESSGWFMDDIRLPGIFGRPCEGDFDNDGNVDNSNMIPLNNDFTRRNCSLQDFCEADFNKEMGTWITAMWPFSQRISERICVSHWIRLCDGNRQPIKLSKGD